MKAIPPRISQALTLVIRRYAYMRDKHGDSSMDGGDITDLHRLAALGEEYGEVCRAMTYDEGGREQLLHELIDVANAAIAWASLLLNPADDLTWRDRVIADATRSETVTYREGP